MSGPKKGRVRPNHRGLLRSACLEARRTLDSHGQITHDVEIQQRLAEARRFNKAIREGGEGSPTLDGRISGLVDAMDRCREDLALLLSETRDVFADGSLRRRRLEERWAASDAIAADPRSTEAELLAALRELIQAREEGSRAIKDATDLARKFDRGFRELARGVEQIGGGREKPQAGAKAGSAPDAPVAGTESAEQIRERLAAEAEWAELGERVSWLAPEPEGGWAEVRRWLGSDESWEADQRALADAERRLLEGSIGPARGAVVEAEARREAVLQESARNQASARQTLQIAEAVMQALHDRNYNPPKFGPLKEDDPLSGLQVRADVPNRDGRGNIRIDFHLDGRTVVEVENVAEGEESLCRGVIGSLSEALAREEVLFEVTDWGRAGRPRSDSPETSTRVPQREKERERAGPRKRPPLP